ncbi:MAG: DUF433 domain-containing protein [Candidatus Omnitrophica bacterium]|nr:DUF433 domain-containing protein [Candidatus Omnitrophota bacterium]
MDYRDYITTDPAVCHGQPCFKGTRIMVWQILELLEAGVSATEIVSEKYFPQLTPDHIRAALHLAAEHLKHRDFVAFGPD